MKVNADDVAPTPVKFRLMAVIFNAVIVLGLSIQLWLSYRSDIDHAKHMADAMAEALNQQVGGSIRGIDGLLQEMVVAIQLGQWSKPSQRARFEGRLKSFPELRWIGTVTPEGRLNPETVPDLGIPSTGADVSDREYFSAHLGRNDTPHLHVGQAAIGKITGERTIHLSRPVIGPDGHLMAIAVAAVSPDYYAHLLDAVLLDREGGSAILRLDGMMLARAPQHEEKFGINVGHSDLFLKWLPRSKAGVADLVSKADGNDKLLGYRQLDQYPLVVTSGLSRDRTLESWRKLTILTVGGLGCIMLAAFYLAVVADRREAAYRRYQAELEQAVSARTAALVESTKLAERRAERIAVMNGKLTRLAQVAAHHLQEPVRPVVSFTQLLRRELGDNLPPVLDERLRFIEDGGQRLKNILEAFQGYTELLGTEPRLTVCDLGTCTATVLRALAGDIGGTDAQIHVEVLPTVRADRGMMETLLSHLISNALKYHHPYRRPQITVDGDADERGWWLSISDNGPGLPQDLANNLFPAFTRPGGEALAASGLGLGLAVCQAIAEMHGGQLHADSSPKGTRFVILVGSPLHPPLI